ncbi:LacI family DNA-binding transcriptional regulator [Roseiarcus sp.]|uniref:LacI family DNA-binding transcriptional regulator n=1 Tax=Roseiarcus sp. TaxID=1969460 RepID=UPI003F980B88
MIEKTSSINDVARMAGVSPATVSNVLTGRKPVSAELVKKVEAAVKALDYRADPRASMLRSGEARIIAVLVPDLDNPFFTSVVSAVEQCLGGDSYEVIVASSHGAESMETSKLKAILAWRPAGLIVVPCSDDFPGRKLIDSSETPYVIADRVTGNLNADTVSVDNEEAGALGARHLIDLGHKDILIAASSLTLANIRQRCSGASQVLRSRGLPEPPIVELGFSIDDAAEKLSEWFDRKPQPTAIQALTNFTTLSVLTTLAERGLRMPGDISLIGFDDYMWMRARATPLTAIFQPVREMGRALWETLSARIKGDLSPAKHVLLPCELRVRASTGPAPDANLANRPGEKAESLSAGVKVR